MPEFTSIEPEPPQGSCPSTEDLACYIDGTLSPGEAARVAEHLALCETCFEVYSDILQFQIGSEQEPRGKVVPFPPEKRSPPLAVWWSSIAALLVVGVGVGVHSYVLSTPPALVTAQVTASIQGEPALWLGPRMRGGGEEGQEAAFDEASLRMGVQIVNLQIRLRAGDRKDARDIIAYILQIKTPVSFFDKPYADFGEVIDKAKDVRTLLPQASQLASEARELLDPLYFDLGQLVEAGRLAAIAQSPTFFHQSENRSFLRHVLWRDRLGFKDSKLPAETRGELDAISKIAGQGTLQPADFAKLQGHFENILKINYPR